MRGIIGAIKPAENMIELSNINYLTACMTDLSRQLRTLKSRRFYPFHFSICLQSWIARKSNPKPKITSSSKMQPTEDSQARDQ